MSVLSIVIGLLGATVVGAMDTAVASVCTAALAVVGAKRLNQAKVR